RPPIARGVGAGPSAPHRSTSGVGGSVSRAPEAARAAGGQLGLRDARVPTGNGASVPASARPAGASPSVGRAGGMPMAIPPGAAGRGGARDGEHRTPAYLVGKENGEDIVGGLPLVGPTVIGDWRPSTDRACGGGPRADGGPGVSGGPGADPRPVSGERPR
ncbi:hypothetical protein P0W64_20995, partial [Tsukamurella sp. 8F]|nr:hypothetical protein [Tsukamurella sp. 8F]